MRIFNTCVFDGMIQGGTTASPTYTDPKFDAMLGAAEKLGIACIIDMVQGTSPALTVAFETSPDRRNWIAKNATAEIAGKSITSGGATCPPAYGYDLGTNLGFGFGRLNISLAAGSGVAGCHIRIFATGHAEGQYR